MAKFTAESFTSNIVAIAVAIIVFTAIALPMVQSATTGMEDGALKSVIEAVPVFIGVGLLMACIALFVSKRNN